MDFKKFYNAKRSFHKELKEALVKQSNSFVEKVTNSILEHIDKAIDYKEPFCVYVSIDDNLHIITNLYERRYIRNEENISSKGFVKSIEEKREIVMHCSVNHYSLDTITSRYSCANYNSTVASIINDLRYDFEEAQLFISNKKYIAEIERVTIPVEDNKTEIVLIEESRFETINNDCKEIIFTNDIKKYELYIRTHDDNECIPF